MRLKQTPKTAMPDLFNGYRGYKRKNSLVEESNQKLLEWVVIFIGLWERVDLLHLKQTSTSMGTAVNQHFFLVSIPLKFQKPPAKWEATKKISSPSLDYFCTR